MKNALFALTLLLLQLGCQNQPISHNNSDNLNSVSQKQTVAESAVSNISEQTHKLDEENTEESYSGVTIDQKFPLIEYHYFMEGDFKNKTYSVNAEDFQVTINNFAPQSISKNGKNIFKFKTLSPKDYWASLVGVAHLLGENSKQIYVTASGPGGVCCTNYWIVDISHGTPRNIFRGEDFGGFRNPMEIFDADGDGIYELVQFDSAFRYFMDDCGSCSPEPRAVFKYDKKSGEYLPAKSIQQDFIKEYFVETEKQLAETFEKLSINEDVSERLDFQRSNLSYIVDLFYLGDERKAWKAFDKYYFGYANKEKIRSEIKNRLRSSKFYQSLKKVS